MYLYLFKNLNRLERENNQKYKIPYHRKRGTMKEEKHNRTQE